jgi:hypothetical protein
VNTLDAVIALWLLRASAFTVAAMLPATPCAAISCQDESPSQGSASTTESEVITRYRELAARVKAGADVAASYREWLQVLHEPEEEGSEEDDVDEAAEDADWYNEQAAEADAQMEEEDT